MADSRTHTDSEISSMALSALNTTIASVTTTDGSDHTIATIPLDASTTTLITGHIVARRTGGSLGSAEDAFGTEMTGIFKVTSGSASLVGSSLPAILKDQILWKASFAVSGGNALINVTGSASNNISWTIMYKTVKISS